MKLLLSLGVYTVGVLVLPSYVGYITDNIKRDGFRKMVIHIFLTLLIVVVLFLLGWYGLTPQSAASAKTSPMLEKLNKQNLIEEATLLKDKNLLKSQNLDQALQVIRAKFDDALYSQEQNNFDRALKLYQEIERGSDENGSFFTFKSAAIKNNMAISFFSKQGDKAFKASSLLFEALQLEPKPKYELDLIQRNIDALDRYVNQ